MSSQNDGKEDAIAGAMAAEGNGNESIHEFMFQDDVVDVEVAGHADEYANDTGIHDLDSAPAAGKRRSTGFNMKWVFGGILAVGLVATVVQMMVGGKAEDGVAEPVSLSSGEQPTQMLPAEMDGAVEAPSSAVGADGANAEPAPSAAVPGPTLNVDPVAKGEANPELQSKVTRLEKDVDSLKEQIAGLRQLVDDRKAVASYQQKTHRPKRVSASRVANKPQANAAPAALSSVAQPAPVEPTIAAAKRYTLRGIVYGQAAVERNGSLVYVREGDPLGETRVTSIDLAAMEVRLANGLIIK